MTEGMKRGGRQTCSTTPFAFTSIVRKPETGASTVNMMALQPRSSTFFSRRSDAIQAQVSAIRMCGERERTSAIFVEVYLEN
jgi:hypothetical protein